MEQLRRLLIQARGDSSSGPHVDNHEMKEAREIVRSLGVRQAYEVTKSFAIYFELTNLAETNHRKRRRRAGKVHAEQPPLPGSFRGTLERMRSSGISAEHALRARLSGLGLKAEAPAFPTTLSMEKAVHRKSP